MFHSKQLSIEGRYTYSTATCITWHNRERTKKIISSRIKQVILQGWTREINKINKFQFIETSFAITCNPKFMGSSLNIWKYSHLNTTKVELSWCHELKNNFVRDSFSFGLKVGNDLLQHFNQFFLQKTGQQLSARVIATNFFQSFVVFQKEFQILKTDVNVAIAALFSMLFDRRSTARKCVLVDFVLDLSHRIAHENGRIGIRRAHLSLDTLQGGKEYGMHQGRFFVAKFGSNVACHSKVRILIDGTWNQTRDVLFVAKDERKGGGKGRRRLDSGKGDLSDAIRVSESENSFHLIESDCTLNFDNVFIESRTLTDKKQKK